MSTRDPESWVRAWNAAATLAEAAAALGTTTAVAKSYASKLRARGCSLQDFRMGGEGAAALVRKLQRLRTERDQLLSEFAVREEIERLAADIMALRTRGRP